MTDEIIELLPCPLCGCEEVETGGYADSDMTFVLCPDCGVAVDVLPDMTPWNNRATPAYEPAALAEHVNVVGAGNATQNFQDVLRLSGEVQKANDRAYTSEQRNAELVELLNFAAHYLQEASFNNVGDVIEHTQEMRDQFRERIDAALNPAESGAKP